MHRKTHPFVQTEPKNPVITQDQRFISQQPQQNQSSTSYPAYLSTLTLGALQKQLQVVREKEKQFYKLNYQLKMLEKRSRVVTEDSRKLSQAQSDQEDEEIAQLKAEIEGVNCDIKNITEEAKSVKKQCGQSKAQLKLLEEQLENAKSHSQVILKQVNQKKSKVIQKSSIVQGLKQSQLQTHKHITSVRQQIKSLQLQSHLLENNLNLLNEQKQNKHKNHQKLKKIITQLQQQLAHQKDHERQTHYKLSHIKSMKQQLESQLLGLRKLQQSKIIEYESKLEEYHKVSSMSGESDMKKKTLEDQLMVVQNDLRELNLQFIAQGELLMKEQEMNARVNDEFDLVTKEAIDVWNSICELIKIQQHEELQGGKHISSLDSNDYDGQIMEQQTMAKRQDSNNNEIKFKAVKVWKEIESIIQVNQSE